MITSLKLFDLVERFPYPHIVADRLNEFYNSHECTENVEELTEVWEHFKALAVQRGMGDPYDFNKTVFRIEGFEQHPIYIGLYDNQIHIGLGVRKID